MSDRVPQRTCRSTHVSLAERAVLLTALLVQGSGSIAAAGQKASAPRLQHVPSRPETIVWGEFPIDRTPIVTVRPGEVVQIDTLSHQGATQDQEPIAYLGSLGVRKEEVLQDVIDFWKSRSSRPRDGRAAHLLTGPVYVEGAEPGDTLEVQILAFELRVPYGINAGTGVLGTAYPGTLKTDSVPEGGRKLIRTGTLGGKPVAFLAKDVVVPVRPFMGIMAVAPPAPTLQSPGVTVAGVANSRAPGIFGGNMDLKELTAGASLFLPVFHNGGQFYVGDPHSAQGDGEVDGTALEHSLTGTFRFVVHKGGSIPYPRVETPTHHILMGIDVDLNRAMRIAVQQVVDFLMTEKKMTPVDALALASIGCDFHVAEAVDLTQVIVGKIPKSVFRSAPHK
jgi:acetamidase/formamidase